MSDNTQQVQPTQVVLPVGGDKAKGAKYIAEHPEEFGFSWKTGKLGRGVGKDYVEYNVDFPFPNIEEKDVYLFLASFGPALFSGALGGSSIKVTSDRVNRTEYDNNVVSMETLKIRNVESVLLKVASRGGGTVTKYVDAKGVEYRSKADLDKAVANQAKIDALTAAAAFMAQASDNNIDPTVAREMAKVMWPLAFASQSE
jgi:hypothetical protein